MLIIPIFYYNILVCNNNWKNVIEIKKYNSRILHAWEKEAKAWLYLEKEMQHMQMLDGPD